MSERTPGSKNILKGAALTVAGALAVPGLAACDIAPVPEERPTPSISASSPELDKYGTFQRQGLEMARGVLRILADPKNGAEYSAERGNFAGFDNKAYVIGKDGKGFTHDDGKATAEARMYYKDGKLYFLAVDSEGAETKDEGDDIFDELMVDVSIGADSVLAQKTRDGKQVTIADFDEALGGIGDGDARVELFEGQDSAGYDRDKNPGFSYRAEQDEQGRVKAVVDRGAIPDIEAEGREYTAATAARIDALIDESIKGVS